MIAMNKRCVVVGGGAAGMMAAYSASVGFNEVILLEKNEKTGKKIYITGKGRCNVTNDCEPDEFFKNIVSNPKFMYSAYYGFDQSALMRFIEESGCPLKTERGNRVFPVSDHSSDVIKALNRTLESAKVKVRLNTTVKNINVEINGEQKRVTGVTLSDGERIDCDRVILATGGLSYASTGSTGDGHRMLKELGHTITECRPALVPLTVMEGNECAAMQGLSLKNVAVRMTKPEKDDSITVADKNVAVGAGKKKKVSAIYEGFGEMLFTHFGLSGPLILSASSEYAKYVQKSGCRDALLHIDLKPALSFEQLDNRVLRDFDNAKNKDFRNVLGGLLPSSLIPVIIKRCGISPDRKVHDITKEERLIFVRCIKDLVMHINGTRGYNEAIITQGGVSVKEIDPSTMESKIIGGLFVAGELLDIDAYTGGFNLQIAWSTGYAAGTVQ